MIAPEWFCSRMATGGGSNIDNNTVHSHVTQVARLSLESKLAPSSRRFSKTLAVWCSTLVLTRVDWLAVNPSTTERNGETYCNCFGKLEEQRTGIFLSSRSKIKNFRFGAGLRVVGAPRDRSQVRIASAIYCTWPKALNAVSSSRRAV